MNKVKKILNIKGMSCQHCVRHVEEALKELDGVIDVYVNLDENTAIVEMQEAIADELIKSAIEEAGYELAGIK